MCVIIQKPENIDIDDEVLYMCWAANKDGAGFMFAENNKLYTFRGYMKFKNFYKSYLKYKDRELVIHFRWASCGKVSPAMCHPFKINENLAVVHNGHIDIPFEIGEISDSLWFVKNVFKKMPKDFLNIKLFQTITILSIGNSVMVFMDNLGNITIIGDQTPSMIHNGCWFSNYFWIDKDTTIRELSDILRSRRLKQFNLLKGTFQDDILEEEDEGLF